MFGLGVWEIMLIVLVVVVLFGAKKLPDLARSLGRSSVEFRKGLKGEEADQSKKTDKESDKPKKK